MINLNISFSITLRPTAPYNFDATVYNPSHFPTPDSKWEKGSFWHTFSFESSIIGMKMENDGNIERPKMNVIFYSRSSLPENIKDKLVKEVIWRYDLKSDISEFYRKFQSDELLEPTLYNLRGMKVSCEYSLYEFLMIMIVLQNATVKRSTQMIQALLNIYGTKVMFDDREFYAFWKPKELVLASEEEIRNLKVGYRAKIFKKLAEAFAKEEINEQYLRSLDKETARREILKLYGIGPISAQNVLFEVLHHYDAFDVVPRFEQKIYSKLLFGKDFVPSEEILRFVVKKWGKWRMLALHHLWEDLFWKLKTKNVEIEKFINNKEEIVWRIK